MSSSELAIEARYRSLEFTFGERSRRLWSAAEALAIGRGGVMSVHRATGISRPTIYHGIKELEAGEQSNERAIRSKGGGREKTVDTDSKLRGALEALLEPIPVETRNRRCVGLRKAYVF